MQHEIAAPAIIRATWLPKDLLKGWLVKPRKRITPGARVDNMVALRKALTLCFKCKHKFLHKPENYIRVERLCGQPEVMGQCDGCANPHDNCTLFMAAEHHQNFFRSSHR